MRTKKVNYIIRRAVLFLRSAFFLVIMTLLPGCDLGGGGGGEVNPEQLRLIHAAYDFGRLSLSFQDAPEIADASYGHSTGYLSITEGKNKVRVRTSTDVVPSISEELTIASGKDYTYLITQEENAGGDDVLKSTLLTDDNSEPDDGLFKIRFVNASIISTSIDFFMSVPDEDIDQTAVASKVAFKGASSYVSIDRGTYRVRVTKNGESKELYDSDGGVTFEAGKVYTLIFLEDTGGGKPFHVLYLTDKE